MNHTLRTLAACLVAYLAAVPAWGDPGDGHDTQTHGGHYDVEELAEALGPHIPPAQHVTNHITQPVLVAEAEQVIVEVPPTGSRELTVSYRYEDLGDCPDPGHIMSAQLRGAFESLGLDYSAHVRTAPSGGDCRVDSLSYNLTIDQHVGQIGQFDVQASFGADKRSINAPYAITDGMGNTLARADGHPSDPVTLPAGAAETVTGALSMCHGWDNAVEADEDAGVEASGATWGAELCLGGNVVPTDWIDGESSRTARVTASLQLPTVDVPMLANPVATAFDLTVDAGSEGHYGDAQLRFTSGILSLTVRQAFGLDEVDAGVPAMQTFAGLPAALQGAPTGSTLTVALGGTVRF